MTKINPNLKSLHFYNYLAVKMRWWHIEPQDQTSHLQAISAQSFGGGGIINLEHCATVGGNDLFVKG